MFFIYLKQIGEQYMFNKLINKVAWIEGVLIDHRTERSDDRLNSKLKNKLVGLHNTYINNIYILYIGYPIMIYSIIAMYPLVI
jgi:hypothetical protein